MAENNKNQVLDMGKTAFSLFSFKTKMIIIGVAISIFIVVIVPVVAIMGLFSNNDKQSTQGQGGGNSSNNITVNEVIPPESLKKYINAKFPMPFETWASNKDVVTSKYSPSRTITVNGVTKTSPHTGIDLVVISISNPKICAVLGGKVVVAKAGSTGYGNYVVIEHTLEDNSIIYTLYAHMKQGSIMVAEGSQVQEGQVLGIMGSTGNSTGNHLHFEIRVGENSSSKTVDPFPYLFGE
ncbi:MAG: M23 family metallopeptidase [Clostridiales bacterium]|nr:M23 family metallopeptidase [Clostridiales bacterium]